MLTALSGTLIRGHDGWYWSDGARAAQVSDLLASAHYNFRVCNYATTSYIEVPVHVAANNPDLAWVLMMREDHRYDDGLSGDDRQRVITPDGRSDHGTPVIMVPAYDWDVWSAAHPIGAQWDKIHEDEILARAAQLGWQRPHHDPR